MRALITFMLLMFVVTPSSAYASQDWNTWLQGVKDQARADGISDATINVSLNNIQPIPRIIELDRKQPEGSMTFAQYKAKVISDSRIKKGRKMMEKHTAALQKASDKYGVPAQFIVSLWGVETSYGGYTGGFDVVNALATLAHDGRRSEFFRKELMKSLKIIDEGHIAADDMKGSWAGAMGQNQFMPSSFFAFAVDGNGDGKIDIWNNHDDIFASTANYLATSGWKTDERWGRAVKLPQSFNADLIGLDTKKSLSQWSKIGITQIDGSALPIVDGMSASLVAPDGADGDAYLVYDNYRVIMKWNKSTYFATSVGLIADAISY